MPVKVLKPNTPGQRGASFPSFEELTRSKPEKSLLRPLKKHAGRNSRGVTTVRHRGGGSKRHYRLIDFKREKFGVPAKVASVEYDPNRSARIALLNYRDGEKRYIIHPVGLEVGSTVLSGPDADILVGNALPLKNIPLGTTIHNIELRKGKGAQLARSAGSAAQLVAKEGSYAQVKMPSGEVRRILENCKATIGQVGNLDHKNQKLGKAGRSVHRGRRPTTYASTRALFGQQGDTGRASRKDHAEGRGTDRTGFSRALNQLAS